MVSGLYVLLSCGASRAGWVQKNAIYDMIMGVHTLNKAKFSLYTLCGLILVLITSACTTGGEIIVPEATIQAFSETAIARVTEVHAAQATSEAAQAPLRSLSRLSPKLTR
jgi:hypothetical protein